MSDLIKSKFYQGYTGGVWRMKFKEAGWRQEDHFKSCLKYRRKKVNDLILNTKSKNFYMQNQKIFISFIRKNL